MPIRYPVDTVTTTYPLGNGEMHGSIVCEEQSSPSELVASGVLSRTLRADPCAAVGRWNSFATISSRNEGRIVAAVDTCHENRPPLPCRLGGGGTIIGPRAPSTTNIVALAEGGGNLV